MPRQVALPPILAPRLIERVKTDFARYVAAEQRTFDHLCANGKLFTGIKRPKGFRQMRRQGLLY